MKKEHGERRPRSTAGFFMTRAVPIVQAAARVAYVRSQIHARVKSFDTVDYIYVIDKQGVLFGILSYRMLLSAAAAARMEEVCKTTPLYTIALDAPADDAAHVSLHHDVVSVPVVDENRRLLGVIPSSGIVRILHQRRIESLFHRAGVANEVQFDNVLETPLLRSVRHRVLWLVLGMIGGLLAAKIISLFEHTLASQLLLAAFIPLVVYIADAVRTQLEAFAIRDITIFRHVNTGAYIVRQLAIVVIIAVVLGGLSYGISFLMYREVLVSGVIALSIIGASLTSVVTGILIPFMFRTFALDPANASGPIGTILQDLLSVSVYFSIAAWLL